MQSRFALLFLAAVLTTYPPHRAPAQTAAAQPGVSLVKLSPPVYPPLARQARISGDVSILVVIRPDGTVEKAEAVSGHSLLRQSAVDSALKSTFECKGYCENGASYSVTYTFEFGQGPCPDYGPHCESAEERAPQVTQRQDHVTLTTDALCTCDPIVTITRLKWRSAKCLYLWHCGSRVINTQYK
jgi:TonB family protein